jgi:hypothetical protein
VYTHYLLVSVGNLPRPGDPTLRENAAAACTQLHSLQGGVGIAWMGALPTKTQLQLDDATGTSVLRFQLWVSPGAPVHQFYRCTGYRSSDMHHAMTFDKLSGLRTMHRDHGQLSVQYGPTAAGHGSCMSHRSIILGLSLQA